MTNQNLLLFCYSKNYVENIHAFPAKVRSKHETVLKASKLEHIFAQVNYKPVTLPKPTGKHFP